MRTVKSEPVRAFSAPVLTGLRSGSRRLSAFPLEWLDTRSWRLPSGQALAEFALQAGFLAPLLLQPEEIRRSRRHHVPAREQATADVSGKGR